MENAPDALRQQLSINCNLSRLDKQLLDSRRILTGRIGFIVLLFFSCSFFLSGVSLYCNIDSSKQNGRSKRERERENRGK